MNVFANLEKAMRAFDTATTSLGKAVEASHQAYRAVQARQQALWAAESMSLPEATRVAQGDLREAQWILVEARDAETAARRKANDAWDTRHRAREALKASPIWAVQTNRNWTPPDGGATVLTEELRKGVPFQEYDRGFSGGSLGESYWWVRTVGPDAALQLLFT